jgi:8-oxo-dGTP pyrophosphatase MutT (NUDIX family)
MTDVLPIKGETDLPVVERRVVRLAVLDEGDRLLLFHGRDLTAPELGTWWELPGGGLEPGETYADAAIRELSEEAGILAQPNQVGAPSWRRSATFRYRGTRWINHERVLEVRLDAPGPEVDGGGRVAFEKEDYFGFRWWPLEEVISSRERFYPGRLPKMLLRFLAGESIDEPFEYWS